MAETSVVIPVRNGARFIAEALASVLEQIGADDEVIAVDDGSTDGTPAILAAIRDPRLRIVATGGRGVAAARNRGCAHAQGGFLAFLDHDDLWPAGRHAALRAALTAAPSCDAAFGRVSVRFEPDAPDRIAQAMDRRHVPELVGTGLYRRGPLARLGGFNEEMRLREDAEFHQRLVEARLGVTLVECTGLVYRRHGGNITNDAQAMRTSLLDLARRRLARRKAAVG